MGLGSAGLFLFVTIPAETAWISRKRQSVPRNIKYNSYNSHNNHNKYLRVKTEGSFEVYEVIRFEIYAHDHQATLLAKVILVFPYFLLLSLPLPFFFLLSLLVVFNLFPLFFFLHFFWCLSNKIQLDRKDFFCQPFLRLGCIISPI